MKTLTLAGKNTKEILRDPLNLAFGLGFPIILLLLLRAIAANVPAELFAIERLTPGITVFGLSFMTLFSAMITAKDRESSLLKRLYTAPLTAADFICGYTLPLLPISLAQSVICYAAAVMLGLELTVNVLYAAVLSLPAAVFFIALGLLCGSVMNDKQVGGVCGALLTNLTAWLSGAWFDLALVGGLFEKAAYALPFVHAVEMERAALAGNFADILPHLGVVAGYAAVTVALAVVFFVRQMKRH